MSALYTEDVNSAPKTWLEFSLDPGENKEPTPSKKAVPWQKSSSLFYIVYKRAENARPFHPAQLLPLSQHSAAKQQREEIKNTEEQKELGLQLRRGENWEMVKSCFVWH